MVRIDKRFGQVVRRLRKERGWSQEVFAVKAGIHRTYVGEIELGKVSVSISKAAEIARALGVPLSELVREAEG